MNTAGSLNSCMHTLKQSVKSKHDGEDREQDFVFYMFLHDMKNPITTSRGFLSRLLSNKAGSLTEKQKEYLETIYCNHEEIESLLKQFLDILGTESKHLTPDFITFDVVELVSKIIDTINIEAEQKGIKVLLEYSYPVHDVCADVTMVTRVIRNLLDNALKNTPSGGTITVLVIDRDDDVLIQIIDTGNGIPRISIPYIFNPFYQVRKNGNGSGLGLYIVKQLIELQGGKIWMESIHGKETSCSFTLQKFQGKRSEGSVRSEEKLYCFEQEYPAQGSFAYKQDMVAEKLEFRCSKCNKLLAKTNGKGRIAALIKCTRCGEMNEI
ncbi:MAG: hypothetical protein A2Y97_04245 [Nitrospirae bacterium RBG_13_39_12]|nr:MAG: hypothetical protein A2Y97_04245 [Nitrospirae bacterium RBG_13_39_12]